jgi:lon-related putative ATP-dependent protease
LTPEDLRRICDPAGLGVTTTAEAEPLTQPLGQPRALGALEFGTRVGAMGYNVFVMGVAGTGRTLMTKMTLESAAAARPAPVEWCYVHNFEDQRRPRALALPCGRGAQFRHDMEELIKSLDQSIRAVFESDDYQQRRDELLKAFREERQAEIAEFERGAQEAGFAIGRGPDGLIVAPAKEGEIMPPQDYAALPEAEREVLEKKRQELQEQLIDILRRGHRKEHDARDQVRQLDRETVQLGAAHLIEEVAKEYADLPEIEAHLKAIMGDLVENVAQFRDGEEQHMPLPLPPGLMPMETSPYSRYRVNLLVEPGRDKGAPVVHESNPTLHNLTGEVEYQTQMGALVTDFTMIRAGALHRANGGYLILEALALLQRPYAWDALKRCLTNQEIKIESLGDQFRFVSTVTLEPESLPLDLKVVLIGTPQLYYLLHQYDEDFGKLFKVKADLGTDMARNEEGERLYLGYVARTCQESGLPAFSAGAVAQIVEHGSRLAGDQARLTTRFMDIGDLIQEAAHWAAEREAGAEVQARDVVQAIDQHVWRSNRIEERLLDLIEEGVLMVTTEGSAVGQVNGIALMPLGDYTVGKPSRITARTYLGRPGVVNIEREVKLSGPIHDKGVLIISGYLGEKYAVDQPLSCAVSLVFEQSYDEIEGDSASAAELFALLSSLGEMPLRQDLAVTGSVNQHGIIQPVGGVTRKVEGFFDTCKRQGLTGTQGVLLPVANRAHLMLRVEVVQAVRDGQFHLYTMETLDEGLELLTSLPAGEIDATHEYPAETIHGKVQRRLAHFARVLKEYAAPEKE